MPRVIRAIAFDVFETLFAMEPLRARLAGMGLKGQALELWYSNTLRDGFALSITGQFVPYRAMAKAALLVLLATAGDVRERDDGEVEATLDQMSQLPAHADVEPCFRWLAERGIQIVALSNGAAASTRRLLSGAKLEEYVQQVVSIDDIQRWKPQREIYEHAAKVAGVSVSEMALVAAHAWDVRGAKAAGLRGAWVRRKEQRFNELLGETDAVGDGLREVCEGLVG